MFCTGTSTADADAPPAIANDSPATPNAGATFLRVFRFELVVARAIGILHNFGACRPFAKDTTFSYFDHFKKLNSELVSDKRVSL